MPPVSSASAPTAGGVALRAPRKAVGGQRDRRTARQAYLRRVNVESNHNVRGPSRNVPDAADHRTSNLMAKCWKKLQYQPIISLFILFPNRPDGKKSARKKMLKESTRRRKDSAQGVWKVGVAPAVTRREKNCAPPRFCCNESRPVSFSWCALRPPDCTRVPERRDSEG
jgi:hypothetical protein